MKRLIIIVEGYSEEEFVNNTLRYYFIDNGIFDCAGIKIQTSPNHKGGFVNYEHLKNDIEKILHSEADAIVSTFVDFFRIPTSVPGYQEMLKAVQPEQKVDILEQSMARDINHYRFVPYIQKFEFESLLFSNNQGFSAIYGSVNPQVARATQAIIDQYDNPEDINNHPNTAPSKRIQKILAEQRMTYDKVFEGNLIALEIGIHTILEKCPRFRAWVEKLMTACQ
jgi:hypothetical protein